MYVIQMAWNRDHDSFRARCRDVPEAPRSEVEPKRRVDPCTALRVLSPEAEGVIPYEQKERLEASERIVNSFKDPRGVIGSCDQGTQP